MPHKATMLFLLLFSVVYAGGSYYQVVGVSDDDTLTVRQSASATSKKIGSLQPYDTGLVIDRCEKNGRTTWCSVNFLADDYMFFDGDFPGNGGWVNKKYLRQASDIIYSDALSYKSNHNIFRVYSIEMGDTLNVREYPRLGDNVVGTLRHDDVGIIARKCQRVAKSNWCYVAYTARYISRGPDMDPIHIAIMGWVNMRYLKLDNSGAKSRLPGMTFAGEVF